MAIGKDAPSSGRAAGEKCGMKPLIKGLIIAAVQVGLVASLGAKLLYDRATRPRLWTRAAPYDPNLPIRGRYVSLQLVVEPRSRRETKPGTVYQPSRSVSLRVERERLVAERIRQETGFQLHLFGARSRHRSE